MSGGEWADLERRVVGRLLSTEESTARVTASALRKLGEFKSAAAQGRKLFRRPRVHGELEACCHNEWSLLCFAEWLLARNSAKTGRPLAVNTIVSYVSLIKTELSVRYGFALVGDSDRRWRRAVKAMRKAEPVVNRKKRRGLRGHHLRKAWKRSSYKTDRSVGAVNEWAAVAVAREAVARGGELCPSKKFDPDAPATPTRADVTFEEDRHGRTATLWLRPLKKRGRARAAKVPIIFAAYDGRGSDTYAALRRLFERDPTPPGQAARTPLFRRANGAAMRLAHFTKIVKEVARLAGQNPAVFSAHSPRIGGATDIGDESPLMLQAKGRWGSDIGKIYSRLTRRGLVRQSRAMQRRGARDMEQLYPGFTQPA